MTLTKQEHALKLKTIKNTFNFKTNKNIEDYLKFVLHDSVIGEIIETDHNLLWELLKCHCEHEHSIPLYFTTMNDGKYKTNHFVYIDNTTYKIINFSFRSCLQYSKSVINLNRAKAFRNAVSKQIKEFQELNLTENCICPITGFQLFNDSNTHVDHNYNTLQFKTLTDNFIQQYDLTKTDLLTTSQNSQKLECFKNPRISYFFRDNHAQHAELRLVYKPANLKEL